MRTSCEPLQGRLSGQFRPSLPHEKGLRERCTENNLSAPKGEARSDQIEALWSRRGPRRLEQRVSRTQCEFMSQRGIHRSTEGLPRSSFTRTKLAGRGAAPGQRVLLGKTVLGRTVLGKTVLLGIPSDSAYGTPGGRVARRSIRHAPAGAPLTLDAGIEGTLSECCDGNEPTIGSADGTAPCRGIPPVEI